MPAPIPFVAALTDVAYGRIEQVSPAVQRVMAQNPSKYTYMGTGTYIVGRGTDVAVIDPGPELDSHKQALAAALDGRRVGAILITHTHGDHSPLAAWLRDVSGAPTYGFGPHGPVDPPPDPADDPWHDPASATATPHPNPSAEAEEALKGESNDTDFRPDVAVRTGHVVNGGDWTFTALHTPGHTSNHACWSFAEEATLFSGDHVMAGRRP